MRFTEIGLENFRGFSGWNHVPLHPELTVLVGVNGAGKSSVLDAAASAMTGIVSWISGENRSWFGGGDDSNIFAGATSARWGLRWGELRGQVLALIASMDQALAAEWRSTAESANFPDLTRLRDDVAVPTSPLPLLCHIHSSSTRPPITLKRQRVKLTGRLLAYADAFDSESIQFKEFSDWFEQEENLENQEKIRRNNLHFSLPSLKAIRTAVQRFLSHLRGANLTGLTVIRSRGADPNAPPKGRLAIHKHGIPLFIEQLSDGERRLILMVADTARRMVILNPGLADPLESPGCLLVDEIELHLHPQWQRTVIGALRAAFPQVQWVFATHAPAVLATVPNECVVVIDGGKVLAGTHQVFGRDPNTILSTVMDTPLRPDEVQKELDALFSELDAHPRKARKRLKALEERLGADDPDLVRARALMQFMGA